MRTPFLLPFGAMLLAFLACGDDRTVLEPTAPSLAHHDDADSDSDSDSDDDAVAVSGSFVASVDFRTLTLTPQGENCLLVVDGVLSFTGTIVGDAPGTTTALVFATCDQVATNPPGTFPDVFRSKLRFGGTVAGETVEADVLYIGSVQVGGAIDARLVFDGDVEGVLTAEAIVAVGGTYEGSLEVD